MSDSSEGSERNGKDPWFSRLNPGIEMHLRLEVLLGILFDSDLENLTEDGYGIRYTLGEGLEC